MASPDGNGYLIPENPTPDELNCLLVFYPDDPLYLQALLGSISYLGTWTAWERDAAKRGRLAAAAWKDANDCTFDAMGCLTELISALTGINQTLAAIQAAIENQELSVDNDALVLAVNGVQSAIENQQINLDAGDLLPALTGIQTAIEDQELTCNCGAGGEGDDMVINNNLCCGGCGCGGANQPSPVPPPDLPPEDTTPPQPDIPPYDEPAPTLNYDQFVCNYSHYLYYKFRLLVLELGNLIAIGEANYGRVIELIGATNSSIAWYHAVVWGAWYSIVSYAVNVFTNLTVSAMVQEMDRHYDEFVCGLFSGDGAEGKRANWISTIDSLALAWPARYWLKLLTQNIYWSYFYTPDWQSVEFPPSFQNRPCCGLDEGIVIIPLPDLPENDGYDWVYTPMTFEASTSIVNSENKVTGQIALENGLLASFALRRTTTDATAAALVTATMTESRNSMVAKYGTTPFYPTLAGVMIVHGSYTKTPTVSPETRSFYNYNNFLSGSPTWDNGGKTLLLNYTSVGDQFLADGGLDGFTVKRNLAADYAAGELPYVRIAVRTAEEASPYAYHTVKNHGAIHIMAIWKIPKQN